MHNAQDDTDHHEQHSHQRYYGLRLAKHKPTDGQGVYKTGVIYDRDSGDAFALQRVRQKNLADLREDANQ